MYMYTQKITGTNSVNFIVFSKDKVIDTMKS